MSKMHPTGQFKLWVPILLLLEFMKQLHIIAITLDLAFKKTDLSNIHNHKQCLVVILSKSPSLMDLYQWRRKRTLFLLHLSFSVTAAMFLTILLLATSTVVILLGLNQNQIAIAQQQQSQTSQGLPIVFIPAVTGNILAVVSFLIGTSSFILGLRIQSAARTTTGSSSSPSSSTLPSSAIHKYFELLILALVIPAIGLNTYGILILASHLYPSDSPYLSLLYALFIPAGAILFLVIKLRIAYGTNA